MALQSLRIWKNNYTSEAFIFSVMLKCLRAFTDALSQKGVFWCGFASVGMLPAVYCGSETSTLPYSRTGQKPVNETGLQGVTYRPCWCFRLFKRILHKRWRCYRDAECHSNCITASHLKDWEKYEVKREGHSRREREKEYLLEADGFHPDTDWAVKPTASLQRPFSEATTQSLLSCIHMLCVKTNWDISDCLFVYAPEWPSTVSQSTCSPSSRAR